MPLRGKKLLILGATENEIALVRRAQHFGVYTIVTDYHTDWSMSPCKPLADEAWDVSWSDMDTLEERCRRAHVDGVLAGYSEFRVENMMRLCERLGMPCYINERQLDVTRDKVKFKDACRRSGVPVVKEYASPEEVDAFPVIVKPVDRAGSIGISIAGDPAELKAAYDYAMSLSPSRRVIIEEFIHQGEKFDVYYAVCDGEITLLTDSDTVNAASNGFERVVQSGWLLPSRHHEAYVEQVDGAMRRMLRNLEIRNGYIFFSGFAREQGDFAFFEAGYRLSGGHVESYTAHNGLVNYADIFLCHALTGSTQGVVWGREPLGADRCAIVNYYARGGTVRSVDNAERVAQIPGWGFTMIGGQSGQVCEQDKAILDKMAMFHFYRQTARQLADSVSAANEIFSVTDTEGSDMIYDRIDPAVIAGWWRQ